MKFVKEKYEVKAKSGLVLTHETGASLQIEGKFLGYCRKTGYPIVLHQTKKQTFPNYILG